MKLLNYGVDLNESCGDGFWIIKGGKVLSSSQAKDKYCWHEKVGKYDVLTVSSTYETIEIKLNSTVYQQVAEGINVWTYDMLTEAFVETACFEKKDDTLQTIKKGVELLS